MLASTGGDDGGAALKLIFLVRTVSTSKQNLFQPLRVPCLHYALKVH